jgi:hypothetical protein
MVVSQDRLRPAISEFEWVRISAVQRKSGLTGRSAAMKGGGWMSPLGRMRQEKQLILWGFKRTKSDRSTSRQAAKIISDEFRPTLSIGFENLHRSLYVDALIKQGAPN